MKMNNELVKVENGEIVVAQDFTRAYAEFQKKALEMDLKLKEVKEKMKIAMEENNRLTYEDDFIKITYRKASTRTTVDSAKLKKELPDIYEEYSKTSNVSSSISVEAKC